MYPETKQILVIDNDADRRMRCVRLLGDEGFAVTAVAEGFSAIRAAAGQHFALAVAAMQLPGTLDGPATLRQMRARQPWLRALFTGDAGQRPLWPGPDCDDFIAAPFHRRDLLGGVFELLQRQPGRAPARGRGRLAAMPKPLLLAAAMRVDRTGGRD